MAVSKLQPRPTEATRNLPPLAPPRADAAEASYDLNVHDGEVSTVWRHTDSGVRLADDRIVWPAAGQTRSAALSDIAQIRLSTAVEGLNGPMGATSCQIR